MLIKVTTLTIIVYREASREFFSLCRRSCALVGGVGKNRSFSSTTEYLNYLGTGAVIDDGCNSGAWEGSQIALYGAVYFPFDFHHYGIRISVHFI